MDDFIIAQAEGAKNAVIEERNSQRGDGKRGDVEYQEEGVDVKGVSARPKKRAVILRLFVVKHDG
jgi:hypothetical protein